MLPTMLATAKMNRTRREKRETKVHECQITLYHLECSEYYAELSVVIQRERGVKTESTNHFTTRLYNKLSGCTAQQADSTESAFIGKNRGMGSNERERKTWS